MSLIKLAPYIIDSTLDFTFHNVTATGNLISLNANLGNVANANYFSGNGSLLSSITGANITGNAPQAVHAYFADTANSVAGANVTGQVGNALVAGTVYTAAQPNITSVGTLTDLSVSGNITLGGNLTVNGTVTSINSTVVQIDDLALVLANDASTSTQANGAGIIINGAAANILYINSTNSFTFSHKISADGGLLSNISGANVTGEVAYAAVANSVAVANVTGIGNIATINKDGNASNILYGNGVFAAPAAGSSYGNSNVATYLPTYTGNLSPGNITIPVGNLKISGGSADYVLKTDGTGNLSWVAQSGGGGGGSTTLDGLTDVTITSPTNNQVLSYDSANSVWVNKNAPSGGGSGASVTVDTTPPTSPSEGDMWLDSDSGELNVYFGGAWASVTESAPQFTSMVNSFTGDSLTTNFTLSTTPAAKEYTLVAIGGILQPKSTYSISGNVLTTSSPVPSNTPIEVTVLGGEASTISTAATAATVTSPNQPNITSTGTLVDLSVSGNLQLNNTPVATTGKAIAMAIVFGF